MQQKVLSTSFCHETPSSTFSFKDEHSADGGYAFPSLCHRGIGVAQPPYSKPPRRSSSARPGACMTPSRLRFVKTITLLINSFWLLSKGTAKSNRKRSTAGLRWEKQKTLVSLYSAPKTVRFLARGSHTEIWSADRSEYEGKVIAFIMSAHP